MAQLYPDVKAILERLQTDDKLKTVVGKQYRDCKERLLLLERQFGTRTGISDSTQRELIEASKSGRNSNHPQSESNILVKIGTSVASAVANAFSPPNTFPDPSDRGIPIDDETFLCRIPALLDKYPVLADLAQETVSYASGRFAAQVKKEAGKLAKNIETIQKQECMKHLRTTRDCEWKTTCDTSRTAFLRAIDGLFRKDADRCVSIEPLALRLDLKDIKDHHNQERGSAADRQLLGQR